MEAILEKESILGFLIEEENLAELVEVFTMESLLTTTFKLLNPPFSKLAPNQHQFFPRAFLMTKILHFKNHLKKHYLKKFPK